MFVRFSYVLFVGPFLFYVDFGVVLLGIVYVGLVNVKSYRKLVRIINVVVDFFAPFPT